MKVGWCSTALEADLCFAEPKRLLLDKDKSQGGRGFLSCPSVRSYFSNTYVVTSPFSLRLTASNSQAGLTIRPVYPFTSLVPARVQEFVKVEPKSSWRSPDAVVIQLPSPYLFFADEPVVLSQDPVLLNTPTTHNWRLIPGKFNIYDWQRPLNWAFEWFPSAGDFIIRTGEPIYYISFEQVDGYEIGTVQLVKCELSEILKQRMKEVRGITSIRKGVTPLYELARNNRQGIRFLEK